MSPTIALPLAPQAEFEQVMLPPAAGAQRNVTPDPAPLVEARRISEASYSTNAANSLIHLYRAEIGKMPAYRARLDTTTNWSVVTTAGLASFSLGSQANSHAVFLFAMFLNYYFLHLKARRFRTLDISHHRVCIKERFFYPAMLGDKVDANWHQVLLGNCPSRVAPSSAWTRWAGGCGETTCGSTLPSQSRGWRNST